jgi:polyhydroxybutyrate depolymerase
MQIHGISDSVVPFNGNLDLGMKSVNDVVEYWKTYNSCEVEPIIDFVESFGPNQGIEHIKYINCLNNVQVELYKIDTMGHTWPREDDFGISASKEIWDFINTYDINGRIN